MNESKNLADEAPRLCRIYNRFIVLAEGKIRDEFTKVEASEHRVMLAATSANEMASAN